MRFPISGHVTSRLVLSGTTFGQSWQLDQQDNWLRQDEDADGDGRSDTLQTRAHDASNRITQIQLPGQLRDERPGYDANGNMVRIVRLPDLNAATHCQYDPWNRLTHLETPDGDLWEYEYDGAGRRIVKRKVDKKGKTLLARHYYYDSTWRLLEERVEPSAAELRDGAKPWQGKADRRYVWGIRRPDDLILRDRDTKPTPTGDIDERLYALSDANGNVVSLYDVPRPPFTQELPKGVVERVEYDAYGLPYFMDEDFQNRGTTSAYEWNVLFGGYYFDEESGLYHVRRRMYHPRYGRWLQTDPAGFQDSYNLYQYGLSSPLTLVDPSGGYIESVWDIASIGIGLGSLGMSFKRWADTGEGAGDVAMDVLGLGVDIAALMIPFVPGGVGAVRGGSRAGSWAQRTARATQAADAGLNAYQAGQSSIAAYDAYERGDYWGMASSILFTTVSGLHLTSRGMQQVRRDRARVFGPQELWYDSRRGRNWREMPVDYGYVRNRMRRHERSQRIVTPTGWEQRHHSVIGGRHVRRLLEGRGFLGHVLSTRIRRDIARFGNAPGQLAYVTRQRHALVDRFVRGPDAIAARADSWLWRNRIWGVRHVWQTFAGLPSHWRSPAAVTTIGVGVAGYGFTGGVISLASDVVGDTNSY